MNPVRLFGRLALRGLLFLLLTAATLCAAEPVAAAVKKPAVPNSECMDCHEAEFKPRKKGQAPEWIGVRPELFAKSVHAKTNCVDCHDTLKEAQHPSKLPPAQCTSCHDKAVTQFATSIHGGP